MLIKRNEVAVQQAKTNLLLDYKEQARTQANQAVGKVRTKYISDIPAQQMIYQAKESEALAFLTDPTPNMEDYPFLQSETGILAPTAADVAEIWVGMSRLWRNIAAALEAARMKALNAIEAAHTQEGIDAALDALSLNLSEF